MDNLSENGFFISFHNYHFATLSTSFSRLSNILGEFFEKYLALLYICKESLQEKGKYCVTLVFETVIY